MKRIILTVALVALTGCAAPGPLRTGKICIEPIISVGYSTSDPIDIRPDVVEKAASMLQNELIVLLGQEKGLHYVSDCAGADFVLLAKVKSLDTEYDEGERTYFMTVVSHLDDGIKKPVLSNMFMQEDGMNGFSRRDNENLFKVIKEIAENIIEEIREIPVVARSL